MAAGPGPQRGRSAAAPRLAVLSTVALAGCIVAGGSLRAILGFVWVVAVIAAFTLEWNARRQAPPAPPAAASPVAARARPRARRGR